MNKDSTLLDFEDRLQTAFSMFNNIENTLFTCAQRRRMSLGIKQDIATKLRAIERTVMSIQNPEKEDD